MPTPTIKVEVLAPSSVSDAVELSRTTGAGQQKMGNPSDAQYPYNKFSVLVNPATANKVAVNMAVDGTNKTANNAQLFSTTGTGYTFLETLDTGLYMNYAHPAGAWSTDGRYCWIADGVTTLNCRDFGATFVATGSSLVSANAVTIASGGGTTGYGNLGSHVVNQNGSTLYILANAAGKFQTVSIASATNASVTSTATAGSAALNCSLGVWDASKAYIYYPSNDQSGVISRILATAGTIEQMTLPVIGVGGPQIEPESVFLAGDDIMYVLAKYETATGTNQYNFFWMAYDVAGGFA